MRLVPGEEFGRYRVEAEIGRGGQAVVYRATQLDLDRAVALKVFDEGYLTRAGALERFRREAIAAGRLEHPRIVPVYDAGDVGGRAYMAMRFIPGVSLAERIARGGPLPPDEALAVLSDIAAALDFAHARGTIHRDVKPANILLDQDGTSFLGDFGLVRLDDMPGLTRRGDWLGTAEYVSPEQVEGEPATAASAVYGLAAVAFEALTGRAPFVRREPSAVLLAHVREPVPDASAIRPGLPVAVDETLARGLAKDPADRFANANTFVGELRHALDTAELRPTMVGALLPGGASWDGADGSGEAGAASPAERLTKAFGDAKERTSRFGRGRQVAVAAAVAGVLVLVGAGWGGWALGHSSADASGAESRGYQAGEVAGLTAGQARGQTIGFRAGKKEGLEQGKKAGRAAGLKVGIDQGKEAGYSSGYADGRSSALSGLSPGSWYIVKVGSDDSGATIASSRGIPTDASTCFAVSGNTLLSGGC
ncbi:MAG TPA: protein kinase [Miltoncostaea sp.]|nr:protein kinase [Miltoncostaea sp.]